MFKISDGRDKLYQWDIDDTLNLVGTGAAEVSEVHFCHKYTQQPLTVAVDHTGDVPTVKVPNILLQKSNSIIVYAYCRGEDAEYTRCDEIIKVEPRPKPTDYVYTETELLSYKELAEQFIEKLGEVNDSLSVTLIDDGAGNVSVATQSGAIVPVTDDGAGNVTIGLLEV